MSMASSPLSSSKPRGGIPRGLGVSGPPILSYGFRPFFLAAGSFAVFAMLGWIGALTLGWGIGGSTYGALTWHAHEMIFGYAVAALAGYMLTAIPNWTGRLPVSGLPLLRLVLLWAAGRIAMLDPDLWGLYPAVVLDAAFLPAVAAIAAREIIAGRNWKNLKILVGLVVLALTNMAFHTAVLLGLDLAIVMRAGVGIFVALVGLVGGRVIPSFTRNWLVKNGSSVLPAPFGRFDVATMVALVVALLFWMCVPDFAGTAGVALVAAILQAVRLVRWRGIQTLGEPLLFILHVGFAFVPLGLFGVAMSALGWISAPSTLHILTVGVIGIMTLAIMTRASLGHTGRVLSASPTTSLSYLALVVAAVVRPFAELLPEHYHLVLEVSGAGWILAFGLFSLEYGAMLLGPRLEKASAGGAR